MEGYPDYDEILNDRERRRKQEMEGGRQRTLRNMADGLFERLCDEITAGTRQRGWFKLNHTDNDPRKWVVEVRVHLEGADLIYMEENLWDFPSQELKTKLMLIS